MSVVPDLASPRGSGTSITFTATATGGTGPLQYRWIRYLYGGQIMQDWSTSNVFVWTPTLSSDLYQIKVQVRSAARPFVVRRMRPAVWRRIDRYLWVVWNGSSWINATSWSTSNTFDWTPATPNANYKVAVRVRSAWNTGAAEITTIQPFPIQ